MKILHSRYRVLWSAVLLLSSPLLAGADGNGCGGSINVGSGTPTDDAGTSCAPANCAGLGRLDDAKVCADGTTLGRTVCAKQATNQCAWDFPACPSTVADASADTGAGSDDAGVGSSCTQASCAGLGATTDAKICADGTTLVRTLCATQANGKCGWDFPPCPPPIADASGSCVCPGPAPSAPNMLCSDGSIGGPVCATSSAGTCSWQIRSCPDASPCPRGGCALFCPDGMLKDANGCDTCQCAPAVDAGSSNPCAGKTCGDSCSTCLPNQPCLAIAQFCDANGRCGGSPTSCGNCCPATWNLYSCTYSDGGAGQACHNPSLGCASSSTCGVGCDPVVTGRCGP